MELRGDSTYRDGAGNAFTLTDLRVYLGGVFLDAPGVDFGDPFNPQEVLVTGGGDTLLTERNVNAVLYRASSGSAAVVGEQALGGFRPATLEFTLGLPADLQNTAPASPPSGSILRTQPRLLNFSDGRGYVQARLEYRLADSPAEARRVSTFGLERVSLAIPADYPLPDRGENLTLELVADLGPLFAASDLSADSVAVAAALEAALPGLLRVVVP